MRVDGWDDGIRNRFTIGCTLDVVVGMMPEYEKCKWCEKLKGDCMCVPNWATQMREPNGYELMRKLESIAQQIERLYVEIKELK